MRVGNFEIRLILVVALSSVFTFEMYQRMLIASNIRPVADNYCLAGVAGLNPIDCFKHFHTIAAQTGLISGIPVNNRIPNIKNF
jgi:hypothetical protein